MSDYLGVVDFGIGGLGFYKALKARAKIPVLYYADNGGTPYGRMPKQQLRDRLQKVFDFLFAQGATKIAIACNAASAAYDDTDNIAGIISFGARMIADGGWQEVGLIAGRSTVQSQVYRHALSSSRVCLTQRIAQPLSEHIEAGRITGDALHRDLKIIMKPLRRKKAVLLACTHYPAIAGEISKYVDDGCALLDPAEEMASEFAANWQQQSSSLPDRFFVSGSSEQFRSGASLAFGISIATTESA